MALSEKELREQSNHRLQLLRNLAVLEGIHLVQPEIPILLPRTLAFEPKEEEAISHDASNQLYELRTSLQESHRHGKKLSPRIRRLSETSYLLTAYTDRNSMARQEIVRFAANSELLITDEEIEHISSTTRQGERFFLEIRRASNSFTLEYMDSILTEHCYIQNELPGGRLPIRLEERDILPTILLESRSSRNDVLLRRRLQRTVNSPMDGEPIMITDESITGLSLAREKPWQNARIIIGHTKSFSHVFDLTITFDGKARFRHEAVGPRTTVIQKLLDSLSVETDPDTLLLQAYEAQATRNRFGFPIAQAILAFQKDDKGHIDDQSITAIIDGLEYHRCLVQMRPDVVDTTLHEPLHAMLEDYPECSYVILLRSHPSPVGFLLTADMSFVDMVPLPPFPVTYRELHAS